jgi:DNA-binding CsgD family transcriptional regulator
MSLMLARVDSTLLDLYAGVADAGRWPRALDRLCADTGACSAVVQAFSFSNGRPRIHWSMQDSRTRQRHAFLPHGVEEDNPRLDPQRALRGLNRVARDEELFDPDDAAYPRLRHQLATLGLGRFIGTLQDVGDGRFLGLALHRTVDDRTDFGPAEIASLTSIAPHLGQAFALTDRWQANMVFDDCMRQHLDHLRCGLVLCDLDGRVRWLNRCAGALIDRGAPLRLGGEGLRTRGDGDADVLLRELAAIGTANSPAVRYLRLGTGDATLHLALQAGAQPATVMVVITDSQHVAQIPPEAIARTFGLTPTEAALVGALVAGSTVEDYALHRGVSVGTARIQLKQVQAKTGARRQAELVRLVLCSAAGQLLPGDGVAPR